LAVSRGRLISSTVKISKKQYNLPKGKMKQYLRLIAMALKQIRQERINAGKCTDGSPMLTGPVQTNYKKPRKRKPIAEYKTKKARDRQRQLRAKEREGRTPLSAMSHHPTAQYTPEYERRKLFTSKKGGKRKGGRRRLYTKGDRLRLTGAMLASQHITVKSWDRVLLGFSPEEAGKAFRNDLNRPFVKFTREEMKLAQSDAKSAMDIRADRAAERKVGNQQWQASPEPGWSWIR